MYVLDGAITMSAELKLRISRLVVSFFLILHAAMVLGFLTRDTAPGGWLRDQLRPYESLAGVYQNWDMFAPNPPGVDLWMEVWAIDSEGQRAALPPIRGAREHAYVEWRYQRGGKLERNLLNRKRRRTLKAYARTRCEAVPGASQIQIVSVRRRTPTPEGRLNGETHSFQRDDALVLTCP